MSPPTTAGDFQELLTRPTARPGFECLFPSLVAPGQFEALWGRGRTQLPYTPPLSPEQLLQEAHDKARQILAEAQTQAQQLAASETECIVDELRSTQTAAFAEASEHLLTSLQRDWDARLLQIEQEAALLVMDIAREILRERFVADEQAILPTVREGVRRLADSSRVQVTLHPQHETVVRAAQDELAALLRTDSRLEILINETAEPNGCLLQGEHGSLDARLSTRLDAISDAVRDELAHQTAPLEP
jgi:flagellar assembly protein FliH